MNIANKNSTKLITIWKPWETEGLFLVQHTSLTLFCHCSYDLAVSWVSHCSSSITVQVSWVGHSAQRECEGTWFGIQHYPSAKQSRGDVCMPLLYCHLLAGVGHTVFWEVRKWCWKRHQPFALLTSPSYLSQRRWKVRKGTKQNILLRDHFCFSQTRIAQ